MTEAEAIRALMRSKGYPDSWPTGEVLVDTRNSFIDAMRMDPRFYRCQVQGVNESGELCDPTVPGNMALIVIYSKMLELGATDGQLYWDVNGRGLLEGNGSSPVGGDYVIKILALFAERLELELE